MLQTQNLFGYDQPSGFNIGDMEKVIVIQMISVLEPFKKLRRTSRRFLFGSQPDEICGAGCIKVWDW